MPEISGYRESSAAASNWKAARVFLELARNNEEGRFWTCAAALVFAAFTHEAFLNSLGPKIIENWDTQERISPRGKLDKILREIDHQPNLGAMPYQCIVQIFEFRNSLAHGREQVVRAENMPIRGKTDQDYFGFLGPDWEQFCTLENADTAVRSVREIAEDLCAAANLEKFAGYPFGTIGGGSYVVR